MNKTIALCIALFSLAGTQAQNTKPGRDWYQKSATKDTMGIDLQRAYNELLAGKTAKEIVVAVIDGGTDITHPDLKANIWHNPGEIPFNNIDDDKNGYVDDTCGWNFIGGPNGEMVHYDNLEKVRVFLKLQAEFEDQDAFDVSADAGKKARFDLYKKLEAEIKAEKQSAENNAQILGIIVSTMADMRNNLGTDNPNITAVKNFPVANSRDKFVKDYVMGQMKTGSSFEDIFNELSKAKEETETTAKYNLNLYQDFRKVVGDNYNNTSERYYGNNNVAGPAADHGTHVAGIIAAVRNNDYGVNGVADHVKIMVVRVVPAGDERDKDVANGIRYAVDNGAKIINMSFGKEYKWNKNVVDSAVEYAVSKGVLLIHAAGNDHKNIDNVPNYPNDSLGNQKFAASWLEVGASALSKKELPATFSNYGKANVDVFAPGYQIYSTTPDDNFEFFDGTSMAAPVTSGLAALVWSYYPQLTAVQVKEILMKSATPVKSKVKKPGEKKKTKFTSLSVSGGVINAYQALQLAASMSR